MDPDMWSGVWHVHLQLLDRYLTLFVGVCRKDCRAVSREDTRQVSRLPGLVEGDWEGTTVLKVTVYERLVFFLFFCFRKLMF